MADELERPRRCQIAQATNFEQRVKAACSCCEAMNMSVPLLVDGMDNRVGEAYSGHPDRLYLIDVDGTVAYKGGRGPFGFIPQELEQSLILSIIAADRQRAADSDPGEVPPEPPTDR